MPTEDKKGKEFIIINTEVKDKKGKEFIIINTEQS